MEGRNSQKNQSKDGDFMRTSGSAEESIAFVHEAFNFPVVTTEPLSNHPHTRATFMAFVDAVIPSTLGALDLRLDDYIVWLLDHYVPIQEEWNSRMSPLASQTARILDMAAVQLIQTKKVKGPPNFSTNPYGGPFTTLAPEDRFAAIRLLENLQVDLEILPAPYQNNASFIKNIISSLHIMVLFGYYSEWFSLGTTRFAYPEDHHFERQPFLWEKLNYPGPAFGYRSFRGYLVEKFSK